MILFVCSMLELECPLGERSEAFTGLLQVLGTNPSLLNDKARVHCFLRACCLAWQEEASLPSDLMMGLRQVMLAVKQHNPTVWRKVLSQFDNDSASILVQMFQLQ